MVKSRTKRCFRAKPWGKAKYTKPDIAEELSRRYIETGVKELGAYLCRSCGHWHLTSHPAPNKNGPKLTIASAIVYQSLRRRG